MQACVHSKETQARSHAVSHWEAGHATPASATPGRACGFCDMVGIAASITAWAKKCKIVCGITLTAVTLFVHVRH